MTTTEGPVLVIAGAGSGKTRVIEHRVAHLVEKGVAPEHILLLTFTRRASEEMLRRASRISQRAAKVEGGTFHSFAYKTLKRYGRKLGIPPQFSVLDEGDAEEAIHRVATQAGCYDKEERFPKKKALRAIVSSSQNKQITVEAVMLRDYSHFLHFADTIEKLKEKYAEYKLSKGYLDYDDLLFYLLLLLQNEDMRREIAGKYKYVMVDEYQDTNRTQGEIVYFLGKEHGNVMIVGDDAQSIYGFRGASHENIMQFPKRFPKTKIIKLEENYRSTQKILDVANEVLTNMVSKYGKRMVSAKGEEGVEPITRIFQSGYKEAEWIAGKIKEARDGGLGFHQQAVLFRSSYVSIPLQAELAKRNIPFQIFGGVKFYETAHAKDLIAHMKILLNPQDELSWNRALMLLEGIGPRGASKIVDEIVLGSGLSYALDAMDTHAGNSRNGEGIRRLAAFLREAEKLSSVVEKYQAVNEYYEPIFRSRFDDWPKRLGDLVVLGELASRYGALDQFLADFVIDPPRLGPGSRGEDRDEEKPLVLSTIHSAKGLEWEDVYFIGLCEGVLPSGFALGREDEVEEEQRLFYVGVTRAKRNLYLLASYGSARGDVGSGEISRFLAAPNVIAKLDRSELRSLSRDDSGGAGDDYDDDGIGGFSSENVVSW